MRSFSPAASRLGLKTMRTRLPSIEAIGQNAPLRLGVAAAVVFPDGTMTASGLRRESTQGRFIVRLRASSCRCGYKAEAMANPFGVP
jgi:hypothetical protein